MRIFKNRFVVGALCIIAGLLFSFIAVPSMSSPQAVYIRAVRLTEFVQAGTQITEEMVETVSISEDFATNGIRSTASAVGKYASTDLYTGDYITNAKVSETRSMVNALSAGTEKGKMVVSITLPSLASGVSGRLLPGDVVTVMAVAKSSGINETLGVEPNQTTDEIMYNTAASTVIYPELQYVEVCMVTTSEGADASVEAKPDDEEKNSLPVTVSFYVSQEQALRLAELEQEGTIYLAFIARGDDVVQYISDEDRVLNTEVH